MFFNFEVQSPPFAGHRIDTSRAKSSYSPHWPGFHVCCLKLVWMHWYAVWTKECRRERGSISLLTAKVYNVGLWCKQLKRGESLCNSVTSTLPPPLSTKPNEYSLFTPYPDKSGFQRSTHLNWLSYILHILGGELPQSKPRPLYT